LTWFLSGYETSTDIVRSKALAVFTVFGKRVIRRIFGRKGEEVTGGWRKLHNEELYNACFSQRITVFFFLDFLTVKGGTDTFPRNVGEGLPFDAA
jgi:hypothetical protein